MPRTLKLIFASLLVAGFALIGTAPTQAKQDQLTSGTPLSAADKKHLLEDNFVLTTKVAAIPLAVQRKLLGKATEDKMVDAGQPYQFTDVIGPKLLPFRRLVFAGTSPEYCVVYNEYGGYGTGQEVSLYRLIPGQAVLAWQANVRDQRCLTLAELRDAVSKSNLSRTRNRS